MSAIPYEGRATLLSIQKETTFGAASAQTVYNLPGKVSYQWQPVFPNTVQKVGLWRQTTNDYDAVQYWQGAFELELGLNLVTKLLLDSFLEFIGSTSLGGGLTQYDYRPQRLAALGFFKLGLEYNPGGPNFAANGVVIDSISITARLKNAVRLRVEFKCRNRSAVSAPALGSATSLVNTALLPQDVYAELGGDPLDALQQIMLKISDYRTPAKVGADSLVTRFAPSGEQSITGEMLELYNPNSSIPSLVANRTYARLEMLFPEPGATGRLLSVNLPACLFDTGTPDGISKTDLGYRATFANRQESSADLTDETKVSLVI